MVALPHILQKVIKLFKRSLLFIVTVIFILLIFVMSAAIYLFFQNSVLFSKQQAVGKKLTQMQKEYSALKNQDQYKINQDLQARIKDIETTYKKSVDLYEKILDLKPQVKDTSKLDSLFAASLSFLSQENYASAAADLDQLAGQVQAQQDQIAAAAAAANGIQPASAVQSNTPPGNGLSQQMVTIDDGSFFVDIIAADLNSTRVIVDTASASDCSNNCPVLPLGDYVARNGAFAGINGTFFCPSDYPSCTGKTGSFDTLLMNKNKYYFNSANNIYSTVPLVYFTGNTMGVRAHSSDWGRDTGVDSVIAMQPMLVMNGNIVYTDSSDPKFTSHGPRSFIAAKGNTVYIGFTFNATMGESAKVMKALGMDNALNLDEGGSSALWFGGYKVGPGRNIPNAVLFVHK